MNIRFALPIALVLGAAFLPACGDKTPNAAEITQQVTEATSASKDMMTNLQGMVNMDSVDKIKGAIEKITPNLDKLSSLKDKLGDKMPSMEGLSGIVDSLKTKFAGNEGIMALLTPFIEKLKGLMG